MPNKQLINDVVLNVSDDGVTVNANFAIPILLSNEDKEKIKKGKADIDLGTINFSEKTSDLIKQTGKAICRELLLKI